MKRKIVRKLRCWKTFGLLENLGARKRTLIDEDGGVNFTMVNEGNG